MTVRRLLLTEQCIHDSGFIVDIIEYGFKTVTYMFNQNVVILSFRQHRVNVLCYYVLKSCFRLYIPGCLMLCVRPIAAICTEISFLLSNACTYNVHFVRFIHHKVYQYDVHLVVSVSCF